MIPRIHRSILLVALALALAAPARAQSHFPADEDLQVMLDYLVEDGATPGIVLGILEADGSTRVLSAGTGGPDTRPLGALSVFEIGSINKTFTGTLLADMVARGEVALDDPVSKYLPDDVTVPSYEGREITLLDLVAHHSGLPRVAGNHMPDDPANPYGNYTVETMYAFLSSHELRRAPGEEFEYSNLGMGLLGHALARAAGDSYRDLVRERVLEPLGMTMTGYELSSEIAEWMVKGHLEGGEPTAYWFGTEAIDGAGGLRSNARDMLAWIAANVAPPETDLGRAMADAHEVRKPVEDDMAIALAWPVRTLEDGRTILTHGGGTGGFSTRIGLDPGKRVGFVLLTNTGEFPDDIGMDFLRRGAPLDIPVVDVPEATLRSYVGRYAAGPGPGIAVRLEDYGYLTIRVPGNVRFRMYPESDSSFYLKRTPWRVRFTRDDAGEVIGIVLNVGGQDRAARKMADEASASE
ncbi:MAG: beta-lactamase family protein [Gemmatimonadetes bacterium]|nr:beta-lactamase family protein [Gemmatimonadota bacterium]